MEAKYVEKNVYGIYCNGEDAWRNKATELKDGRRGEGEGVWNIECMGRFALKVKLYSPRLRFYNPQIKPSIFASHRLDIETR